MHEERLSESAWCRHSARAKLKGAGELRMA